MAWGKAPPWRKGNLLNGCVAQIAVQNPLTYLVMNYELWFCVYALRNGGNSIINKKRYLYVVAERSTDGNIKGAACSILVSGSLPH